MLNVSLTFFKRSLIVTAIAILMAISLSACNTVSGAGADLSAAGHGVKNAFSRDDNRHAAANNNTQYNYRTVEPASGYVDQRRTFDKVDQYQTRTNKF